MSPAGPTSCRYRVSRLYFDHVLGVRCVASTVGGILGDRGQVGERAVGVDLVEPGAGSVRLGHRDA